MNNIIEYEKIEFSHITNQLIKEIMPNIKVDAPKAIISQRYFTERVSDLPSEPFSLMCQLSIIYDDELQIIKDNINTYGFSFDFEPSEVVLTSIPNKMLIIWGRLYPNISSKDNPYVDLIPASDRVPLDEFIKISHKLRDLMSAACLKKNESDVFHVIGIYMCMFLKEIAEIA